MTVKYEFLLSQMLPIIGDRYRCTDCKEKMGFDLCSDCYTTGSKVPGRFNQQHTPEHKFEVVRPSVIPNIMSRLVAGHDDASALFIVSDASENSEDGSTEHFYFSGIAEENLEDSLVIPATSNDDGTEEDQGDSQTTSQI